MSMSVVFGSILVVTGLAILYVVYQNDRRLKSEPKNHITFQEINGKRVAILHMAEVVNSGDDKAIIKAFTEAIHLLYHNPSVDPSDFILAWNAYNSFRDSVEGVPS